MKKRKISLSFIITILVVGLVTLFLLWSTFYFFSLYVESMKQAAQTSSEQAGLLHAFNIKRKKVKSRP